MNDEYWNGLAAQIDSVFHRHSNLYDHRAEYPWLSGALGNPNRGIWFIAENPSLSQIEIVRNPDGGEPTEEAQWWSSRGDKLFREMLVDTGFKTGPIESPGGWNCYITNVIKEADYANRWRAKTKEVRNHVAEIWSSVLAWELDNSKPKLVVILGGPAEALLKHLQNNARINLPHLEKIKHYAYIGQRAEGKLGPMHPDRVDRYKIDFRNIRKIYDRL